MFRSNGIDFNKNENSLKNYYELQNSQSEEDRFVWALTVYKKPQPIRSYTIPSNGVFSLKIQENTKNSARSKVTNR